MRASRAKNGGRTEPSGPKAELSRWYMSPQGGVPSKEAHGERVVAAHVGAVDCQQLITTQDDIPIDRVALRPQRHILALVQLQIRAGLLLAGNDSCADAAHLLEALRDSTKLAQQRQAEQDDIATQQQEQLKAQLATIKNLTEMNKKLTEELAAIEAAALEVESDLTKGFSTPRPPLAPANR